MAEKSDKAAKFIDIKAADKAAPSASSRPLVVTNRPIITNDPMVTPPASTGEPKSDEQPMARTAKTIKPVSDDLVAPETAGAESTPETPMTLPVEDAASEVPTDKEIAEMPGKSPATETPAELEKPAEASAATPEAGDDTDNSPVPSRDAEASSQADEAKTAALAKAEAARQEELEQLIASGRYNAPVNVAQRKRSRVVATVLCIVAVILAVVIFDAALDAGMLDIAGIPHTDFLKDK